MVFEPSEASKNDEFLFFLKFAYKIMFFENDALAYTKPLLLRGQGFGSHPKIDENRILKTTNKNKTSDPSKL